MTRKKQAKAPESDESKIDNEGFRRYQAKFQAENMDRILARARERSGDPNLMILFPQMDWMNDLRHSEAGRPRSKKKNKTTPKVK